MYLLDTNVVSALRRPERHPAPVLWLKGQRPSDVYLSVVTLGEIERGIVQQKALDPDFALDLATWFEQTLTWFADRILPVDATTSRRWGRLSASVGNQDIDLLIAATALEHGLTVVTRNVRHFVRTDVEVLNPFDDDDGASDEARGDGH